MKYRSEIDGLRSLAILPVLFFHVGFHGLSGGFVGVDVFFVISGFLITTIIRDELVAGTFSIGEFYKRRILRIMPALALVVLATYVASYFWLLPTQFETFGASVAATALFLSNIFFWQETLHYFSGESDYFPLLHTWSLAVEEQFYVVFPLLMMAVAAWLRSRFALVILVLSLGSFGMSVWGVEHEPSATFYLLPTRAWELGIGALLAVAVIPSAWRVLATPLSLLGVGLIAYAVLFLSEARPFPGWNAVYPVLGAALIIGFSRGTVVGRVLSAGPLVWIGKISYSLYLWHWPVIVFYRLQFNAQPGLLEMLGLIGLSVALAAFTYAYVEQPFRARGFRAIPTPRILASGAGALAMLAAVGVATKELGSGWQKFPDDVRYIASFLDYRSPSNEEYVRQWRPGTCFIGSLENSFEAYDSELCLELDRSRPNYILIGDSHGGHIWKALADGYPNVNVLQATASGCLPLMPAEGKARCTDLMDFVFNEFLPQADLDGVILAARWQFNEIHKMKDTIERLNAVAEDVIVLGPTVEYEGELPILLAKSRLAGNDSLLQAALDPTRKALSDTMSGVIDGLDARYYPLYDYICDDTACRAETSDGLPMQFDYGHFTLSGAKEAVKLLQSDQQQPLELRVR